MDSQHELEISSAFSSQVNTGVPVEIVEAENQAVESILSNENGRREAEEAMDISVDSAAMDSSRLSSTMAVGSTQFPQIGTSQTSDLGRQMRADIVGTSQLGSPVVGDSSQLMPNAQLSSTSIGVGTGHISSNMGVAEPGLRGAVTQPRLERFQSVGHSLGPHHALEITSDSITFPSSQGPLQESLVPHMMQAHSAQGEAGSTSSSSLDRARAVLENISYADIDISGAINSSVDPNLTVSSSVNASTPGLDSSNVLNDPDSPSSPESAFDSSDLLNTSVLQQDDVTARLAQAGPIGVAAAAAVMSGRKRKRTHTFETNPAHRKRHCSKLVRKLKETIEELSTRVGLQTVVVMYRPGRTDPKEDPSFKVFGAAPLNQVVRSQKDPIVAEMEAQLHQQAPAPRQTETSLHELPPLVFDGIPTSVRKMTQAQLRAFIPTMLKFSTGRGKPGWGKDDMKPQWWPPEVPWANVRSDCRNEEMKKQLSWTDALRRIVIACYVHHGRIDLLPEFSAEHLQQTLSPEAAEQLQIQLNQLQQQGEATQSEEGVSTLAEVAASSQPQELMGSENQQVFTVDTGMGNCDTSGMPTLADASLAETAARLQQVADETGEVQYATQTVTVTDRDAKALGQPVGSTTTVLLTAYPGGHSGGLATADAGQQYLSQPNVSPGVPNVQVVYSAAHIDSIPDSIVSSISTGDTQTQEFGAGASTVTTATSVTQGISDSSEFLNLVDTSTSTTSENVATSSA